jgi:ABC-type lipoprotein export system ATPase subunit
MPTMDELQKLVEKYNLTRTQSEYIIKFYNSRTIIIITHKNKLKKYCDIILKVENQKIEKIKF